MWHASMQKLTGKVDPVVVDVSAIITQHLGTRSMPKPMKDAAQRIIDENRARLVTPFVLRAIVRTCPSTTSRT